MTAQTPAVLKTYFETGDRPTAAQYTNLIDSLGINYSNTVVVDPNGGGDYTTQAAAAAAITNDDASHVYNVFVFGEIITWATWAGRSYIKLHGYDRRVYRTTLALSGTNSPIPTVLGRNDIGSIAWARVFPGVFTATLIGAFPVGSISSIPESAVFFDVDGTQVSAICNRASNDVFNLTFYSPNPLSGSPYDPSFDNFLIEIYVYT